MKIILFLVSLSVSVVSVGAQQWDYSYRVPIVSKVVHDQLKHLETLAVPSVYVSNECQWSDPENAVMGFHSFFPVGISNANGGTILRMRPFILDEWGIVSPTTRFSDTVTAGEYYDVTLTRWGLIPELYTVDEYGFINEEWLEGTMMIQGQPVHILVFYYQVPTQPVTMLSWGEASAPGHFGTIFDVMSEASTNAPPEHTRLSMEWFKGTTNFLVGLYVDVDVSWTASPQLQWSTNLMSTNWYSVTNRPYLIDGRNNNRHSYYLGTNMAPMRYYRARRE